MTLEIMEDPVVTHDGQVYERVSIEQLSKKIPSGWHAHLSGLCIAVRHVLLLAEQAHSF